MEQILRGGIDQIVGGSSGFSVIGLSVTFIATAALVILKLLMKNYPPSSVFGNIAFLFGIIIALTFMIFILSRALRLIF
jgi:hypothetical protein